MRKNSLVNLAIGVLLAAVNSVATAAVQVVEATGDVALHLQAMSSPIPGWCYWTHTVDQGPGFDATQADGDGTYCVPAWLAHCDGDSITFDGHWPAHDYLYNLFTFYHVTLTSQVVLTEPTRVHAYRRFSGVLTHAEHTVTLTMPDASTVALLPADDDLAVAELDLAAGIYTVVLYVDVHQPAPITPYDGIVTLRWSTPEGTPVTPMAWSSIKASYR